MHPDSVNNIISYLVILYNSKVYRVLLLSGYIEPNGHGSHLSFVVIYSHLVGLIENCWSDNYTWKSKVRDFCFLHTYQILSPYALKMAAKIGANTGKYCTQLQAAVAFNQYKARGPLHP